MDERLNNWETINEIGRSLEWDIPARANQMVDDQSKEIRIDNL